MGKSLCLKLVTLVLNCIKIDTKDTAYSDKKDPHVSIVLKDGTVLRERLYLGSCNSLSVQIAPLRKLSLDT